MTMMKHIGKICIISSFILCLLPDTNSILLLAQSFRYEVEQVPYSKELIGSSGTCLLQDSDGFMWFGTTNGLYRYDGTHFKVYRFDPQDTTSISAGIIRYIIEDSEGSLWISTGYGLNRFDKYSENFTRYLPEYWNPSSIIAYNLSCMHEDRNGFIWIGTTESGISRFDKSSETFKNYWIRPVDSLDIRPLNSIDRFYQDKAGILWVQNGHNGISRYISDADSFEIVAAFPCGLKAMLEDRSGRFWITTYCGLYQFDRENNTFERYLYEPGNPDRLNHEMVRTIMEDSHNNLWIRTYDGIYQFNQQLKLLSHWKDDHEYYLTDPDFSITNYLCEDHTGTIWYFTKDGINKIIKSYKNFTVFEPDPITSTVVESICIQDKYNIWLGTGNGLYNYNPMNHTYTRYELSRKDYMDVAVNPDGIRSIYLDSKGVLWMAPEEGGLYYFTCQEVKTNQIKRYLSEFSNIPKLAGKRINHFFEDSDGRLWIEILDQIQCYYDRDQDRIINLIDNPNSSCSLRYASIRHETKSNHLLAARWSGLYKIIQPIKMVSDQTAMASDIIQYKTPGDYSETELIKEISCLYVDSAETFWLGTAQSGLIKLMEQVTPNIDQSLIKMKSYTTNHGLPSNNIRSITEDGRGNLWIGTANGLSRFNRITETFTNYFMQSGLPTNDFRLNSNARGFH